MHAGDLQRQRNIPIPIIIILLKHIRHALQADTALYEEIKADSVLVAPVVRLEHGVHELWRQPVPKGNQRVRVLVHADVPAAVRVEPVEQRPPRCQESPETAELLEADGPRSVGVEHPDHHAHRLRVERGPVAVDQCGAELALCELAAAWRTCQLCYVSMEELDLPFLSTALKRGQRAGSTFGEGVGESLGFGWGMLPWPDGGRLLWLPGGGDWKP